MKQTETEEEVNQISLTVLQSDDKWKQLGGRRRVNAWDISEVETADFVEQLDVGGDREKEGVQSYCLELSHGWDHL